MKLVGDLLFNLLSNAVASFWVGLAAVWLIGIVVKPSRPSAASLVLLLPFIKLVWDMRSGVPASSFFWASERGVQQRLGSFQIGFGVHRFLVPTLEWRLLALHLGGQSPQSFADVLSRWLRFRVSAYAASLLGFAVLVVSLMKCAARGWGMSRFRRRVRALRQASTSELRALGRRRVSIETCPGYEGVPFAGGLLRPYVVLPEQLVARLHVSEREAVVQHELAHVRHCDLALLLPLEFACDFFWFVPGVTWLIGRQRRVLEQRADDCAVAAGVPREAVASALLRVAELTEARGTLPVLAMSRDASTLHARLRRLLSPSALPSTKPWLRWGRALALIWLVLGVLQSSACGNQP